MNKKLSLGVCVSLIAIACAVTFVLTMNIALGIFNSTITGAEERAGLYSRLEEADSYFRGSYIDTIDEDSLFSGIMNGYMKGAGDTQGKYLSPDEYYEQRQLEEGKIITAGVRAEREESGYIKVVEVYPSSSAAAQGVRAGDVITEINGSAVLETGADAAVRLLPGDEGTRLTLIIQRDGTEMQFSLIRQLVTLTSVEAELYGEIGYMRINGFSALSAAQFEQETAKLAEQNAKGLIIDLRGTASHLVSPVRDILNLMVSASVLATAEYKGGSVNNIITSTGNGGADIPTVILTDSGTSGSAELFAAVLKDFKGALVVGNVTAGKAVLKLTQKLRDGSAVSMSYMRVRSAGGTEFNGSGIKPDYLVETTPLVETDPEKFQDTADAQIKKALEVMTTRLQFTQ